MPGRPEPGRLVPPEADKPARNGQARQRRTSRQGCIVAPCRRGQGSGIRDQRLSLGGAGGRGKAICLAKLHSRIIDGIGRSPSVFRGRGAKRGRPSLPRRQGSGSRCALPSRSPCLCEPGWSIWRGRTVATMKPAGVGDQGRTFYRYARSIIPHSGIRSITPLTRSSFEMQG
jgi:hypothetical protein